MSRGPPGLLEQPRDRGHVRLEVVGLVLGGVLVPVDVQRGVDAEAGRVVAGHEPGARGRADGGGGVKVGEDDAAGRHLVEVGGVRGCDGVALDVEVGVAPAPVVGQQEDEVGGGGGGRRRHQAEEEEEDLQQHF